MTARFSRKSSAHIGSSFRKRAISATDFISIHREIWPERPNGRISSTEPGSAASSFGMSSLVSKNFFLKDDESVHDRFRPGRAARDVDIDRNDAIDAGYG